MRQQEIYRSHHIKELLKLWVEMESLKKDVRESSEPEQILGNVAA